jgi:hypothetical protein
MAWCTRCALGHAQFPPTQFRCLEAIEAVVHYHSNLEYVYTHEASELLGKQNCVAWH